MTLEKRRRYLEYVLAEILRQIAETFEKIAGIFGKIAGIRNS